MTVAARRAWQVHRAVLRSGGASVVDTPSDADVMLARDAASASVDVLRGRPCYLLDEWMRLEGCTAAEDGTGLGVGVTGQRAAMAHGQ